MAKEKQYASNKKEASMALEDIRAKYSRIRLKDIESFAPVYYPIAIVEMLLDERTFEDFETVQLTILRLVALGISDHKVIAQTLGLSPNYVFKVMRLLAGFGHIQGTELTELGRESLESGQKIVTVQTLQKFQVDALNGTLLKVRQTVTDNMLNDKDQTAAIIGHLNFLDGISTQTLRMQLTGDNCDNYLQQSSGILHTNVTDIREARCTQIKYAKSYMLKLKGHTHPIVFGKRYDKKEKEIKDRFSWQPFSVTNERISSQCGFDPGTPISTEAADSYVTQLYAMMTERSQKVDLEQETEKAVMSVYPFAQNALRMLPAGPGGHPAVQVDEQALVTYRKWLIDFLTGIHADGEYLITNEYLYGRLIHMQTDSPKLRYLAQLLTEKIDQLGRLEIVQVLEKEFKHYEGQTPLTDAMIQKLQSMQTEKT